MKLENSVPTLKYLNMQKLAFSLFVIILVSCQMSPETMDFPTSEPEANAYDSYSNDATLNDVAAEFTDQTTKTNAGQAATEQPTQKVVKTGNLDFQSKDISADYQKIRQLLPGFKAYIQSENQSKSGTRSIYKVTIRVPGKSYDSLFAVLATIPYQLDDKTSNVQDVTEKYYDLKSRIKNKKALEQRYLDLLSRATVMKDILEIERTINEVRTDIERLQGQFNYLSKQVQMSTIKLYFYEELPYVPSTNGKRTFGTRMSGAFGTGWQGFLTLLVGFTTLWPFFLLVIIVLFLVRRLKGQSKNKKTEVLQNQGETSKSDQ